MDPESSPTADMIQPPVNRAMRMLDRAFFKKTVPLSAAKIMDRKQIARIRSELGHDVLRINRMQSIQSIRGPQGEDSKVLLLKPCIKIEGIAITMMFFEKVSRLNCYPDTSTWSPKISELVRSSQIDLTPYTLEVDYSYWNYRK